MNRLANLLGVDPEEYNQWQLHWLPEDPVVVLTVLGIVIPLALWFFWTSLNRVSTWARKLLLFTLRLGAFTVLLLILLKPELEFRKSQSLKNSIAVLLDNSKSLSIKTKIHNDESTRIDLIKNTLEANASYFENLGKDFNVDYYFFSDEIERVGAVKDVYRPHRPYTNLARVFDELAGQYKGQSLQGVFLFSDGADLTRHRLGVGERQLSDDAAAPVIDGPGHSVGALEIESQRAHHDLHHLLVGVAVVVEDADRPQLLVLLGRPRIWHGTEEGRAGAGDVGVVHVSGSRR